MINLEFSEDEIVGKTDAIKSSARFGCKKANSSRIRRFKEAPLTALALDDAAKQVDPFSSFSDLLFHSTIPCCNHGGRFSMINWTRPKISMARDCLLPKIAAALNSLNKRYHAQYPATMADLPHWRPSLPMT